MNARDLHHEQAEGNNMTLAVDVKSHDHSIVAPQITRANSKMGASVHKQVRGRIRLLTNALWIGILLFSVWVFVGTGPARYLNLRDEVRLVGTAIEQFQADPDLLPGYLMTLDALAFGAYLIVGVLIFWRKSNEGVSFFVSVTLLIVGTAIVRPTDTLFFVDPRFRIPLLLLFAIGSGSIYGLLYTFPDGHFVPRWSILLVLVPLAYVLATYLAPAIITPALRWPPAPISLEVLAPIGLGAAAQIYRYFHRSTSQQRQQTKWVVYGLTIGSIGLLCFRWLAPALVPQVLNPGFARLVYIGVGVPLVYTSLVLFPVMIGISILYYHLWDIDLVIHRTLVYGLLTAILAGVYTACIAVFQKLFIALTGQQSDVAVIASTLTIVAAFTPLKEHLQVAIDKRRKETAYAAKRLSALAEQIESRISPVDRDCLTDRMLREAIAGFDAKGGAVFWEQEGALKLIHSEGEWTGDAQATADVVSAENRPRQGKIALGARRNGVGYSQQDCQVLEYIASVVAKAIEQDREHV